jgi:hypothetical protein
LFTLLPFHNLYYGGDGSGSSGFTTGFGGLIQTASGNWSGLGSPLTNRSGFFW